MMQRKQTRRYRRPEWADEFEAAGHKISPDGTITVYHATTLAKAMQILENGFLRRPADAPDSYGVYFSISPEVAENYGDGTLVKLRVPVEDLHFDDWFPSGRMDFSARTHQGIYIPLALEVIPKGAMPNPWLSEGWLLPDGRYVPQERNMDHKALAALIMGMRDPGRAFVKALKERWVRVGSITVQLPSPPDDSALMRAVEHVRATSPRDQQWDIMVEWWKGQKVVSYRVPILEFMELEGLTDLRRYPKEEW